MNWYYAKNGTQQGPLPTEDMKDRIAMGEISQSDLAWCEGMGDWLPVSEIPQLKVEAPVRSEAPAAAGPSLAKREESPYRAPSSAAPSGMPASVVPGQIPSQGLAIASMVCGILAFIGCCAWYLAGPLALVAIVLGHLSISRIKSNPATNGGKGMARAGLVLGYLGLIGAAIFAAMTIWLSTLSEQDAQDFILKWVPENQREEVLKKFEEERAKRGQ